MDSTSSTDPFHELGTVNRWLIRKCFDTTGFKSKVLVQGYTASMPAEVRNRSLTRAKRCSGAEVGASAEQLHACPGARREDWGMKWEASRERGRERGKRKRTLFLFFLSNSCLSLLHLFQKIEVLSRNGSSSSHSWTLFIPCSLCVCSPSDFIFTYSYQPALDAESTEQAT